MKNKKTTKKNATIMSSEEYMKEVLDERPESVSAHLYATVSEKKHGEYVYAKEDIDKLNAEAKNDVYAAIGKLLCHTELGLFVCKKISDRDWGSIMPGWEKEVEDCRFKMQLGMARSIGLSVAAIERMQGGVESEIDKAFKDYDDKEEKKSPSKRHAVRGKDGRFAKAKPTKKAKTAKKSKKESTYVRWF